MPLYIARAAEPQQGDAAGAAWWQTPYGRWRLAAEAEAMRRFPGFRASVDEDGRLCWRGRLVSALARGKRYLVRVTYPEDFPDEAPEVRIERPALRESLHLLPGGRPCLYRSDGSRQGYEPARTTAATLVAWTALWIHAHETWKATGEWPGAGD